MREPPRRPLALGSCLLLCALLWLPVWNVFCKDTLSSAVQYASGDACALASEDENVQEKGEEAAPSLEPEDSSTRSYSVEELLNDLTKSDQTTEISETSQPEAVSPPSVAVNEASSSIVPSTENTSSSPTSEIPPVSQPDAIENSRADIPVVSSSEAEQSEPDCDIGGTLEADPQSEPSSFVSPPESLAGQHIENISSSHGKGKKTKSEFESKVSAAEKGADEQKSALNASENLKREKDFKKTGEIDPTSVITPKDPGDIPTFDEWKKKVMEVEKEKSQSMHPSAVGGQHSTKKVQKNRNNYASVECGAKILAANPEAKSTSAILMENMDLYMLNPCSTKIWFVVELCEPVQVKQFDIANHELFSSTPKDFLVSISDRYPTNKWIKLGTFHARDERNVQSFPLDEQMYAKYVKMFIKYIKVELISHFGSEHFCPLSLIRVFGTSMVEEYEEIADSQYQSERQELFDEDYDYLLDYNTGEEKSSKNLLGSATNAILSMVNIAANMLGAKTEESSETEGTARATLTQASNLYSGQVQQPGQSNFYNTAQSPSALQQVTVPLPGSQISLPNFGSTAQPLIALPQSLQPPLQHTPPQAQAQNLSRPAQVTQPFRGLIPAGTQHSMIAATGKMESQLYRHRGFSDSVQHSTVAVRFQISEMDLKAFGGGIDVKPGTPPVTGRSTTPTSSPFRASSTSPNNQSNKMNSIVYQKQFQSAAAAVRMTQPFPAQFAPQAKQRAEVLQSTQRFFSEQQQQQQNKPIGGKAPKVEENGSKPSEAIADSPGVCQDKGEEKATPAPAATPKPVRTGPIKPQAIKTEETKS